MGLKNQSCHPVVVVFVFVIVVVVVVVAVVVVIVVGDSINFGSRENGRKPPESK